MPASPPALTTARDIHAAMVNERDTGRRLWVAAERLLGRPYAGDRLIGGPGQLEKLVVDLDGFDCVTFVEAAMALARSRSARGFRRELVHLRYRDGRVAWRTRLHYFSDWMRVSHRRGAVRIRTRGRGSRTIETRLATLAGLPERRARIVVVGKGDLRRALPRLEHGSVVAFASVRARLDFFHVGLLFGGPAERLQDLTLYHASRSRGRVVSVPLVNFLKENRMRGLSFATVQGGTA